MKFIYLLAVSVLATPTPQNPIATPATSATPAPPAAGGGILNQLLAAVATGIGNSGINIAGIDVGKALANIVSGGAVSGAINSATQATPPPGTAGATGGASGQAQSLIALTADQVPNAATNIAAMMTGTAMGMAQSLAGKSVSQQQFTQMLSKAIQDPQMSPMWAMAAQIPAGGM